MSRQTNLMGLSDKALKFIKEKQLQSTINDEGPETFIGMFGEDIWNVHYYYENGICKYKDFIQAEPWSSGPCIFIALWDIENNCPVNETLWDYDDINNV